MGRALITGASMGIGLELARLFAKGGTDLVLVSRNEEILNELGEEFRREREIEVKVVSKDLSQANAAVEVYEELEGEGIVVDEVVNNAGFGSLGTVAKLESKVQLDMIQVNVSALTELTRLFLPSMLERKRGGILNVGSTAGFQAGPNMAVYYATKAYVLSFTEALAEEVRGTGIRVSCLAPGPTRTGFGERSGMENTRLFKMGMMSAGRVARAGYEGFRSGHLLIIPALKNKVGINLIRFLPRFLVRRLVHRLQS